MPPPKILAFDADDTLWVNEPIYVKTQDCCKVLLSHYISPEIMDEKLYATEMKNLRLFGYGVKGFMLSMIETAVELSEGKINGSEIQKIIDLGKEMLEHPIDLLPNVQETIEQLSGDYDLMVITKGDLFDQESKVARSGLADYFSKIEIVSEKDAPTYRSVFSRNKIEVKELLMIGNSLKSDILPICEIGGHAIHIPYHTTWAHEKVSSHHAGGFEYGVLADISLLPEYLNGLK